MTKSLKQLASSVNIVSELGLCIIFAPLNSLLLTSANAKTRKGKLHKCSLMEPQFQKVPTKYLYFFQLTLTIFSRNFKEEEIKKRKKEEE